MHTNPTLNSMKLKTFLNIIDKLFLFSCTRLSDFQTCFQSVRKTKPNNVPNYSYPHGNSMALLETYGHVGPYLCFIKVLF